MTQRSVAGWLTGIVYLWGSIALIGEAAARDGLVTQSYETTKRGEFEVELYNDINFPESDQDDTYHSTHQIELEYGVLDHLQVAYYEVYTWDRAQDWERDAFKVEAKLRFAEAGQWPVDLALYTEYANPDGHREIRSDVLENKVILSKDLGPWNLTGNFIFEKELNTGADWEYEVTTGVSYALTARTRLGVEIKEGLGDAGNFEVFSPNQPLYVIPGIYTSITPHVRLLVGPAFGLTRSSDDLQLKSIVEVEF